MIAPAGYRKNDVALITERSRALGWATRETALEAFLPLSDAAYLVLLALAAPRDSDRGFLETLNESVNARAIAPGALVEALDRLVELGLVAEAAGSDGERYAVTGVGDAVLSAESGRRQRRFDLPTMPRLKVLSGHSMS